MNKNIGIPTNTIFLIIFQSPKQIRLSIIKSNDPYLIYIIPYLPQKSNTHFH